MTILLIAFVLVVLFNFGVIVFGRGAVEQLKTKVSVGKYLGEINKALVSLIGDKGATALKLGIGVLLIILVMSNIVGTILLVFAVIVGTLLAKKVCSIPAVSGALNKAATYVNRLRN